MNLPQLNAFLYNVDFLTFSDSLLLELQTERSSLETKGQILADYAIAALYWENEDHGERVKAILDIMSFLSSDIKYGYLMPILSNSNYVNNNDLLDALVSLSLNN